MDRSKPDVIVVGSGNAAFSAALTARERGAKVLMLEKAPREWVGGNSWFTAGAFRLTHDGVGDLGDLIDDIDDDIVLPAYPEAAYEADMRRVTANRCDPDLTAVLVGEARDAAHWMRTHGVRWRLMTDRQAHRSGGRVRFWGGLAVGVLGGGEALIDAYLAAASRAGIELAFDSPVVGLITDSQGVTGVRVATPDGTRDLLAPAVVLASGGFEADPDLRASHLGPQWRLALVRGTPHNTGETLMSAITIGAQPFGDWSGCHAIAWDASAPPLGDRAVSNRYSRQAYPWGLVVNQRGERFVDEGADFRNYTYARYGAEILRQPGGLAFQLFDGRTIGFISEVDYDTALTSRSEADSTRELAAVAGIDGQLEATIEAYNAAVGTADFDPTVLDGKGTIGIDPPKSNWALPLDTPPYVAYAVSCGITFTFGGIRIDTDASVLDRSGAPIPGLYAAGEIIGGLFYGNYPGGTGLASGTVFGRRAGRTAADHAAAANDRRDVDRMESGAI